MSVRARSHLVIAGPGRSGTTLLVQLLTELGLDTAADRLAYFPRARAGLEADLLDPEAPYVVKDPTLSHRLGELLGSGQLRAEQIEHVIIPIREVGAAAGSRVRVSVLAGARGEPGGIWRARTARGQRDALAGVVYELLLTLAEHEIPSTLLAYPRFARDPWYAFRRLEPLLPTVDADGFVAAWRRVVDPGLIRERERLRTPLFQRLIWGFRARRTLSSPPVTFGVPAPSLDRRTG